MSCISRLLSLKTQPATTAPATVPRLLASSVYVSSAPLVLCSGVERTPLLELYTSEGCSSCPPADSWFRQLRASGDLWTRCVPVAFHVDYWNRLGWPDALSSATATARQRQYAKEWDTAQVYTPEFVLDGHEWRRSSPLNTGASPPVGKLLAERTGALRFTVVFTPVSMHVQLTVTAVLLANGVQHHITAGENSGKRLVHDFAAISLVQVSMRQASNGTYTATVEWPPLQQYGATSLSVAIWVSASGSQSPIQSVGGDLPK